MTAIGAACRVSCFLSSLGALDLAVRIVRRRELEKGVLVEASIDDLHDDTPVSDLERLQLLERELLAAGVIRFS